MAKADGTSKAAANKAKELGSLAADGNKSALKALVKIVTCFEHWKVELGRQRDVNREAKELEGGADSSFENAVEQGLPMNADANAIFKKLKAVEVAWQHQKEAAVKATEMKAEAAEKVKKAVGKLERASSDGAQLTIPGTDD